MKKLRDPSTIDVDKQYRLLVRKYLPERYGDEVVEEKRPTEHLVTTPAVANVTEKQPLEAREVEVSPIQPSASVFV